MSKPSARLGDATAHGGVITGPCASTVLVAGVHAARLGDMHACPMPTPAPHVGGPIVSGSNTVLIEGMPAARLGDTAACNGPPDTIVAGCPTVLVGASGGASGATSGASEGESGPPPTSSFSYTVRSRGAPLENAQCRLFVDGQEHNVGTDSSGLIEQEIPSDAGIGYLIISEGDSDEELHIPMLVGTLKPLNEAASDDDVHAEHAARQRLLQLGFLDPKAPYHYEVALKDFQLSQGIEPAKQLAQETCDALNDPSKKGGS